MATYLHIDFYNDTNNPAVGTRRTTFQIVNEPRFEPSGTWLMFETMEGEIAVVNTFRVKDIASFFFFDRNDEISNNSEVEA